MLASFLHRQYRFAALLLISSLTLSLLVAPSAVRAMRPDPVTEAWAKAHAAGSYHFTSDVIQMTIPVAKVTNVGRQSRTETLRLEGDTNLRENRLQMQLWSKGGSILQDESGVAVKVENGKSYVRQGASPWQESEDVLNGLAPQGDFMAYLSAVRDIKPNAPETRGPIGGEIQFTRYSFTIDGPVFAAFMRDQMATALRAKGELPPSVNLDLPQYYRAMTGDGELWVGNDGLPLRQILNLYFPAQREQTVNAQIVVDFSRFGKVALVSSEPAAGVSGWLSAAWGGRALDFAPLLALFTMTALAGVVLYFRRARLLQTMLACVTILSMVIGPLLSTFQVDAFFATQTAKAAAQEEAQTATDTAQALSASLGRPEFNPQVNPLEIEQLGDWEIGSPSPNLAITQSPLPQTTDDGVDTDADGLSDFVEARVGTDAENSDSDDDGVNDQIEVKGFPWDGQTWYGNPQSSDSNNDGIGDGQEWDTNANGQPDDTDGDGLPDAFDPDNDNDGVPDRLDLSAFTVSAGFVNASPFQLTINQLTANTPTFVDFQVRPNNPDHLWYALQMLDWPGKDDAGQVQDIDSKTFADLAASQGRPPAPSDAFGDMKLLPMLEIRIQGAVTNLPPQSDLTPYNISVNHYSADGSIKIVYVPLNLVTDEQSGARVAFNGRMRYLPTGNWPTPQDIRLVWVVQALVDQPCEKSAPTAAQQGCAADGYIHNVPQVVQSYYDDWRLTGLNVSEQRGAKTALIYEDPARDSDRQDDASLVALAHGLENSFLAGRDQDNNGVRDVTISDLAGRFDYTQNSSATSDQRWGLDNDLNTLRVERHDYTTIDQATVQTAMTNTLRLLNNQFNTAWGADNTLKPTLMYVYEQNARSLSLDAAALPGGNVTLQANGAIITMATGGANPVTVNVTTGVKWTHYCRIDNTVAWAACKAEAYWDELEQRYANSAIFPGDPNDPDFTAGRQFVLHLYDLSLIQGVNRVVQLGNQIVATTYNPKDDTATASTTRTALQQGVVPVVKFLTNTAVMAYYKDKIKAIKGLGIIVRASRLPQAASKAAFYLKNIKTNRLAGTGVVLGAAIVVGGLTVGLTYLAQGFLADSPEAQITVKFLALGLTFLMSVAGPVAATAELAKGGFAAQALAAKPELISNSRLANAVGAVLAIGVTWGFFIHNVISNDISPSSIEFNVALAETIATTLYIILLAIISSTVIGLILAGFLAVTDAILTLVCELGTDSLRGAGGACFSVAGTVINAIASIFYGYELMVEINNQDLIRPGAPDTTLADPNKGFVAGNDLLITLPITNHVLQRNVSDDLGQNFAYFTYNATRNAAFKYSLTQPNPVNITDVEKGQMGNAWLRFETIGWSDDYGALVGGYARTVPTPVSGFNLQPGLNRPAPFYLNVGYALPAFDCWKIYTFTSRFPFYQKVSACAERTVKGNSSTKIETLRYDIFPSTVDGFMALGGKPGGGQGLSWDGRFPALRDADGDGLVAPTFGGLDPNDAKVDADNDGLTDTFELERRATGQANVATVCDSDSDGLTDGQESEFGTSAALRDSDNDGLSDAEEIWHRVYNATNCQPTSSWAGGWPVTINAATPFTVRVTSDPTQADSDGDSISDLAERQLASQLDTQNRPYHPGIANMPPLAVYTEASKRYLGPNLDPNLTYTTRVVASTAMAPSALDVVVPAELGSSPAPLALGFNPLTFSGAQTVTQSIDLALQSGVSGSRTVRVTSNVRARLAPTANSTLTWEPFTFQSLGATGQSVRFMASAASMPDRADSYLITTQTSNGASRDGTGAVLANVIPGSGLTTLFSSSAAMGMGAEPADIACNNNQLCLAVWSYRDHTNGSFDALRGALIRADGQVQANVTFPVNIFAGHFYPQVASDGVDFMVASEKTDGLATFLTIQHVNTAGSVVSDQSYLVENPRAAAASLNSVTLDLAWLGDRYGVIWKFIRPRTDPLQPFFSGVIDRDGAAIGSFGVWLGAGGIEPDWDASGAPRLAYDPVNNRTLMSYRTYFSNSPVAAFLFNGSNLGSVIKSGLLGNLLGSGVFSTSRPPNLAYDPIHNGWLFNHNSVVRLLQPDLTGELLTADVVGSGELPLACPALSSLPVADLRFEDLPGATTFVDSTRQANTTTCPTGSCPSAGHLGATDAQGSAVGTPSSDYSVQFDGVDNVMNLTNPLGSEFSVAFWYKSSLTSDTNGFAIRSGFPLQVGQPDGFTIRVYNFANLVQFTAGGVSASNAAPTPLYNGQWHYVVATRKNNGDMAIFVDGNPTPIATAGGSVTPAMFNTIQFSGGGTRLNLDNLQLYNVALSPSAVQALYNRTLQPYCVGLNYSNNTYRWTKLNASRPDTRGGQITASNALTLTIDSDEPNTTIGGLVNNQYILGNSVHTIGGNATDATAGVARVEVAVNNAAFQPLNEAGSWSYNLAVSEGEYTLRARAVDRVNNVESSSASVTVRADGTAPQVTLDSLPSVPIKPTRTGADQWFATLSGTASDPTAAGVASGLAANAVEVLLQGQGEAVGNGWQTATRNGNNWTLDYLFAAGLPDPTGAYTVSVRAIDNVGNRSADNSALGILRLDVTGPTIKLSAMDASRSLITDTLTLSGLVTDTGTAGVDKVEVAFVTVEQISVLPANVGDDQADAQLNRTWLPASVVQHGATASAWNFPIPAGLENEYQIDLRTTDMLGNVVRTDNVWRGVIDLLAPRVTASAAHLNGPYVFPNRIECNATDRYIDENKFVCPIYNGSLPQRTFDTNPVLQARFPDRTILIGLSNSFTYWSPLYPSPFDVTACDLYGHCTTVNSGPTVVIPASVNRNQLTVSSVAPASAGSATGASAGSAAGATAAEASTVSSAGPLVEADPPDATLAAVVNPAPDNVVASDGALNVTVAAESGALLKDVTILLDNNIVQTLSFAQSENATRILRTFPLTGISEGQHTFVARATDWAGGTQSSDIPVSFMLDAQPPSVTLDPATLTNADTWVVGSNVLRFNGTATDAIGLAAVQIREGNGSFVDVGFSNGVWQTALPVTDPEGRTLNITVRAIDRAGRISEVTQNIGTSLSTTDAPDTLLIGKPSNPSDGSTASFAFSGSASAVAFECQLDADGYRACASPWTIHNLSKGDHTFRVRAIDAIGNVDLTPDSFTWTVNASALDAVITGRPANPSLSRNASFTFTGNGTGFDCALDTAAFTACSSPQGYSGLDNGDHVFHVRARSGDAVGAAARFGWTVTNAAPIANDQTVTTNQDTALAITLVANDEDALTYKVGTPMHGVLLGIPPALTYSPNTGYSGPDSFTFTANDGLVDSNGATVNISVQTVAQPTPTPTHTSVAPTATATNTPTNTPVAPTATPTNTPTNTPVAPTATPTPSGTLIGTCGVYTVYKNGNTYSAAGWTGTIKVGTSSANTLTGGSGRDLLLGLGGNDKLDGKGGDDVLCGGDGVDQLLGVAGNDYLDGGLGNDVLNGGTGDYDELLAGEGNDVLLDGDGVKSAQGGTGNDVFTLAVRNGWRDASGQPRFTGVAGGYGNDTVALAMLNLTRFFIDITGDERDNPPSPLEGATDSLALLGVIDSTSTIIKFERRLVLSAEAEANIPSEEAGAEYLTEPVGDDSEVTPEAQSSVEVTTQLFLPLVTGAGTSSSRESAAPIEATPPVTATTAITPTVTVTTTSTVPIDPSDAAVHANQLYLPLVTAP